MPLFRPIHHTFAPLGDRRQCLRAFGLLWRPWRWRNGRAAGELRAELERRFQGDAFLFSSGREALLAVLRSLALAQGEEVIVQGYTCVVVPNAILAAGCVPIYADIERDSLNLDLAAVERAITPKTRAIICQHTFGLPADTEALRALCDKHSLLLIEDCAHVLPDAQGPHAITRHGDAVFCSFGRDKAVSGVSGGAVLSRDAELSSLLSREQGKALPLPLLEIKALLLYPLLYALTRPFYALKLGKALLALAGRIGLLRPIVTRREKKGDMPATLHALPDALAALALDQLRRLETFNAHRRTLVKFYLTHGLERGWFRPDPSTGESALPLSVEHDLPLQKFPLFLQDAEGIRRRLKRKNIHLYDGWTGCVVCPPATDQAAAGYARGSDPAAENAAESILTLPTHPGMRMEDARRLMEEMDGMMKKAS